jgi:hypothetical protein
LRKFYGGNKEDFGNQLIENNSNELFIAGATASFGVGLLDAYALKINNLGTVTSTFIDGTATHDEIYNSVAISKLTSNYRVCFIEKEFFPAYNLQTKIIEFDFGLLYKNATDYGSSIIDETYKIVSTNDKGYVIVGYTQGYNSILTDVYLVKMDSNLVGGNYSMVSVKENLKDNFNIHVFPNPSFNIININLSTEVENNDIKLYDIAGKEVFILDKILKSSGKSRILNIEELANGIYYLKIFNRTEKISIIH